jgi:hypothetical protein
MWKDEATKVDQNSDSHPLYTGYAIDVLNELSKILGFNYDLHVVADGAYGIRNSTGHWNGMIGELVNGKADLALADLTITSERESVVDFTMPFMDTGIAILGKKPQIREPLLFWSPIMLWIYSVAAFIAVSYFLKKRRQIYPEIVKCEKLSSTEEIEPRCSTKFFDLTWKLFCLVMIVMSLGYFPIYFSCTRHSVIPVMSAADLLEVSNNSDFRFGTLKYGSTRSFFSKSEFPLYQRLYERMNADPSNFVATTIEGINRVKMGNYAFFMESDKVQYYVQRECDLYKIGGNLDKKGFGIAVQQDSPYRALLSDAILQLQETGKLEELKSIYWKDSESCVAASDSYYHRGSRLFYYVSHLAAFSAALLVLASLIEFTIFAKEKFFQSQ